MALSLSASITRGPWGSLPTIDKVGRGMVYGSSGLGTVTNNGKLSKRKPFARKLVA